MLNFLRSVVWGDGTLLLIFALGVFVIFKTRFIQLRCLKEAISLPFSLKEKGSGLTQFSALTTALAGTMGVGNIVGVSVALSIGGAGALFWMWIAAFIGMGIKYGEIYLSVKYRSKGTVGPFGYMKQGLNMPFLGYAFAVITVLTSFGIGNCVQVGAMKECLSGFSQQGSVILSILFMIPFLVIILKKENTVVSATEKIIPAISILYIIGCLTIIFLNIKSIPNVFANIFKSAFGLESAAGGTVGVAIKKCIRTGVSQGVFSNEAGMGSSSIVLSMAEDSSPHKQGLWGVFEVFFDTVVVCTLTGLAVLSTSVSLSSIGSVTYNVFTDSFGITGSVFITAAVSVFAMATLICWSYYGTQSIKILSQRKFFVFIYKVVFCAVAVISVFINFTTLYIIADILNGIMLLINISALFILVNKIEH